jgi:A/G-specific adenine glycosylase
MSEPLMNTTYSKSLIKWYRQHQRDLPWRRTDNPYHIWLSEIILQQTQVVQGIGYYEKFLKAYPTVKHLANAPLDDVLKLWQGLGYYSRARNLHHTAKEIVTKYNGQFPASYDELLKLKGVGTYTAAAISSFAFGLPHAVVDGNVYRVLSRWFDIETPINDPKSTKEFQQLANDLLLKKEAAEYNQAIMEFGSQWCKPVNPFCEECVFRNKCLAYAHQTVHLRPVKINKTKIKQRYLNYFLIIDKKQQVYVQQRTKNDIWKGLYELFLIETSGEADFDELINTPELKAVVGEKFNVEALNKTYKHILSHQHLYARFYILRTAKILKDTNRISLKNIHVPAWPRLIDKFLNCCNLYE